MSFDPATHRALSAKGAAAGHAKKRGNSHRAANLVALLGTATVDDLVPHLTHLTRRQILYALRNAGAARLIRIVGRETRRIGSGTLPATWGPWGDLGDEDEDKPEPVDTTKWIRPANSVFELGDRAGTA